MAPVHVLGPKFPFSKTFRSTSLYLSSSSAYIPVGNGKKRISGTKVVKEINALFRKSILILENLAYTVKFTAS